jgi:DNA-binding CsgD family transcriptional regulator
MSMLVTPVNTTWDETRTTAPAAVVFIKDPEEGAPAQQTLRDLFGLTRTEAAIATALANGDDIPRIVSAFGISTGTVRSHIKTILTKTGTNRQAQVVALIARTVATIDPLGK